MATQVLYVTKIPQAKVTIGEIIRGAVQEVFATKIHPAAAQKSPVTEEGALINEAMGKKPPHIIGTGTNRRSIDFSVEMTRQGPKASLFTQSGYGGYLETGTSKMRAQPYLWPAFIEHVDEIPLSIKAAVEGNPIVRTK